jgi:DNA polymerase (family 10)
MILKREPARMAVDRVFDAAAAHGVALEINGQPDRLDLDEVLARRARERGVKLMLDSDAHSPAALGNLRWSVTVARRAWLEPPDVLNTQPIGLFRASLRRNRR